MFITYFFPVCAIDYTEELVINGSSTEETQIQKARNRDDNVPYKMWLSLSSRFGDGNIATPLSSYGLLVFGGITSAYALKRD